MGGVKPMVTYTKRSKYSKELVDKLIKQYANPQLMVKDIAVELGLTIRQIDYLLNREKITRRPSGFRAGNNKGKLESATEDELRLWFYRHAYGRRAKRKQWEFTLTEEQFLQLVKGRCHYCGIDHTTETRKVNKRQVNMLSIDRLDSDKGYTPDNCVTCCKKCNVIKMDLPLDKFKQQIITIYNHMNLGVKK